MGPFKAGGRSSAHARLYDFEYIAAIEEAAVEAATIASREAGLQQRSEPRAARDDRLGRRDPGTGACSWRSGVAIGYAGPAVILSYAIAAIASGMAMVFSLLGNGGDASDPPARSGPTPRSIWNPWAGMDRPLLLLDGRRWLRRRRRGGRGRGVHDFLVSQARRCGCGRWVSPSCCCISISRIGQQFRLDRILVRRPHQGRRHRHLHHPGGWRPILGIGAQAGGLPQSHRPALRIHAAWIRRRLDGGDHRHSVVQRHRR